MDAIDFNGINAVYNIYTRPNPPIAEPGSGKYDKPIVLKLSTNQSGTICYTIGNKLVRLKKSTIYEDPIYIKKNNSLTYVSAAVYDELLIPSDIAHFQYELTRTPLSPPGFSHNSGSYKSVVNLVISNPNADGKIYYTTNGDEPTMNSNVYSGKICIGEGSTTIKAKIMDVDSEVSSETVAMTYNIEIPKPTAKPTKNPNNGPTCPVCGSHNTAINPNTGNYKCYTCGVEDGPDEDEIDDCPICGSTNIEDGGHMSKWHCRKCNYYWGGMGNL